MLSKYSEGEFELRHAATYHLRHIVSIYVKNQYGEDEKSDDNIMIPVRLLSSMNESSVEGVCLVIRRRNAMKNHTVNSPSN